MHQTGRKTHLVFDMTFPRRLKTGTTTYANELVAAMGKRETFHVSCVAEPPLKHRHGVWKIWNGIKNLVWTQVVLPVRLYFMRADLLHAPSFFAPVFCPCPIVLTVFDTLYLTQSQHYRDRLFSIYMRSFTFLAVKKAAVVCTISNVSRDEIVSAYRIPRDRVRVTYLGVNPSFRLQTDTELAALRDKYALKRPYFLFVGAWEPRKNLPRLIEAFILFRKDTGADYELILVGPKGSGEAEVNRLLDDPEIAASVRYLGFLPEEDKPGIYAAADALTFPSLGEGFGLPIVEAFASGTPVLTSNVSCMPEVAGDAALFFNPEDIADIARTMKMVMQPALRHELREKGLSRARMFTWDNMATETEKAYVEAMRKA